MSRSLLILSILLLSCSESSDKPVASGSSNQLSAGDLSAPADLTAFEKASAAGLIENRNVDFLASKSSTLQGADQESCDAKARNSIVVAAAGDTITVDSHIDMADCYKAEILKTAPGAAIVYQSAYQSLYIRMTCRGKDMSGFQGKKWSDLILNLVFTCEENQFLVNSKTFVQGSMDYMGTKADLSRSSIYAYAMADNSPCSIRRNGTNFVGGDNCVEIKSESEEGSNPSKTYAKFVHKSLEWAESNQNTWYAAGSMDITINNWSGNIVFHGARNEPTYSMASGMETINGSLTLPR